MSQTLKPDIQQIVYNSRARAFNDTSNPAGQKKKKKTWIFQHTLLSDRHPEDHRWCAPGEVNPAPAAAPRLFPGFRERECVGVLPVRSPNERRRRRREKEGGTLSDAGRQEGGRHTHTSNETHARSQAVCWGGMRKTKQRLCHSCKKKKNRKKNNLLSVNK